MTTQQQDKKVKLSTQLKSRWKKAASKLSLKEFARKLLKDNDSMVKDWFSHKSATWNHAAKAARLKLKGARIAAEKNSTKLARRKSKGGGGKSSATTTPSTIQTKSTIPGFSSK